MTGAVMTALLAAAPAAAGVPPEITYQGRLLQGGAPVTGTRSVQLDFCLDPAGVTCNATTAQSVGVQNGLFRTTVTVPGGALEAGYTWLKVSVNGSALSPLERLTAAPFALRASSAAALAGQSFIPFSLGGVERARLENSGFGIGVAAPQAPLHVRAAGAAAEAIVEATGAGGHHAILQLRSNSGGGGAYVGLNRADSGAQAGVVFRQAGIDYWGLFFQSGSAGNRLEIRDTNASETRMAFNSSGDVGIGTTSPDAKLHVAGGAIIQGTAEVESLHIQPGHLLVVGSSQPAVNLSSGCGTGAAIDGNDQVGRITFGASAAPDCTLTFQTSFAVPPVCLAQSHVGGVNLFVQQATVNAVSFSGGPWTTGNSFSYICIGR